MVGVPLAGSFAVSASVPGSIVDGVAFTVSVSNSVSCVAVKNSIATTSPGSNRITNASKAADCVAGTAAISHGITVPTLGMEVEDWVGIADSVTVARTTTNGAAVANAPTDGIA